jgi:hypothetical protein
MNGVCDGDLKTFTTDKEGLPPPNRHLLALHNAICKVAAAYFGHAYIDSDEDY